MSVDIDVIERIIDDFCKGFSVDVELSFQMPIGYETAFGTFDVTQNKLFLNKEILAEFPEYEVMFYLYHELRHAMQYNLSDTFSKDIQESLSYVILYNGTCYKLIDNEWIQCTLNGTEEYFTKAYLSLPYEMDANTFAYEKVRLMLGDIAELKELAEFYILKDKLEYNTIKSIFEQIDEKIMHKK